MKVINNENTIEIKCRHCQSTLKLSREYLKYNYHFGHHSYLYFECGACDQKNEIQNKDLPTAWSSYVNFVIADAMGDDFD